MQPSEFKKYFVLIIILVALLGVYVFIKLPEYAARRERELAEAREVIVTIPEGFNVRQIGETLEKAGLFSRDDFIKIALPEEGYLFPDTYRFYKTSEPADVILRMKNNFNKKITPEILGEARRQNKTLRDIIIMASILEEEAKSVKDKKLVSGILWKRLDAGIGLQVDAASSTYLYRGFPPAPISNPGLDAVSAAVYPTASDYLYYLSDKNGELHYTKTFEEHKLNKFKYLR